MPDESSFAVHTRIVITVANRDHAIASHKETRNFITKFEIKKGQYDANVQINELVFTIELFSFNEFLIKLGISYSLKGPETDGHDCLCIQVNSELLDER